MKKEADDNLITYKELFEGRRYVVPDYQRGYSWNKEHRKDLLEDIENLLDAGRDYTHYMGTIVAAKHRNNGDIHEIVDGQQRIISLFILLHRLVKKDDELENTSFGGKIIDSSPDRILKLNDETEDFFKKRILDGTKIDSENLQVAHNQFDKWLESITHNNSKIFKTVSERLGFLLYTPTVTKEVGIMFEVINNRGKPLSQLEKVKNYLTYYAQIHESGELQENVEEYWGDILENLSRADKTDNEEENSFLRYCWLVFQSSNKKKSYHVYKNLKETFPINRHSDDAIPRLIQFIRFLSEASKYYAEYFNDQESEELIKLRNQSQFASIMPLYLAIRHVYSRDKTNTYSQEEFLSLLDKLNFRVYVCPEVTKRNDTKQGELFGLANKLYNYYFEETREGNNLGIEELHERLTAFIKENCNLYRFVKALTLDKDEKYDYNNWKGLKYFLVNYEKHVNTKRTIDIRDLLEKSILEEGTQPDDEYSKEHIWGRNNDKRNRKDEVPRRHTHEKRRLGNFALIERGLNSRGKNKDISDKLNIYLYDERNTAMKQIKKLEEYEQEARKYAYQKKDIQTFKWWYFYYRKINDQREEKLVNFAINEWGLPEEVDAEVKIDSEKEGNEIFDIQGWERPSED